MAVTLCSVLSASAQKKSGIISFSVNGKDRAGSVSSMEGSAPTDLYFIGENSTKLEGGEKTADAIIKHTEAALKEYFGYDLTPINLNRPSTMPDEMNGSLVMMETITEKTAFNKLGYDEAIIIQVRIYSNGKSGKGYKPAIEITMKVVGKDGKTILKKSEKLKIESEKVEPKMIEYTEDNSDVTITDVFKATKGSKEKEGSASSQGVPSTQVLDWYKQCLANLLLSK